MRTGHAERRWLRRRKVDAELARLLATRQPVRSVRKPTSEPEKRA